MSLRQKIFTAVLTVVPVYLIIFQTTYFDSEGMIGKIGFGIMLCLPVGVIASVFIMTVETMIKLKNPDKRKEWFTSSNIMRVIRGVVLTVTFFVVGIGSAILWRNLLPFLASGNVFDGIVFLVTGSLAVIVMAKLIKHEL